jgi:hypothetical protein
MSDIPLYRVSQRLATGCELLEYRDTDMNLTDAMMVAALVAGCPVIVASIAVVVVAGCALFGPNTVNVRAQRILDRLIALAAVLRGGRAATCFIERTLGRELRGEPASRRRQAPDGRTR